MKLSTLTFVVDDVSNEVMVKDENVDKSLDMDLSRIAKGINLNINESDEEQQDSEDGGDLGAEIDQDSSE